MKVTDLSLPTPYRGLRVWMQVQKVDTREEAWMGRGRITETEFSGIRRGGTEEPWRNGMPQELST